jgi:hypothetical protein
VPVQSDAILDFKQINQLPYRALLYELRDKVGNNAGRVSSVVPNWFGVAIPNPDTFDLSKNVYVVIYFHPTPRQVHYRDEDYPTKTGTGGGTDWKQLYAYVDRLGGQMAGAIEAGAPANRLVVFPFLTQRQYTLTTSEWFNIIHDILQDININVVRGICTRPKKIIVASLSNGSFYLNKFLTDAAVLPVNNDIIEVWDFDSVVTRNPQILVDPHGKRLRAYWESAHPNTATATYIHLPGPRSWQNFPRGAQLPVEVPPLPPHPSDSNPSNTPDADPSVNLFHHYIRDTMFLDAGFNIEADNPSI